MLSRLWVWRCRLGLVLALALALGSGSGPGVRLALCDRTVCVSALCAPVRLREVKQGRAKKRVVVRYTVW